jgi:hypothetical protein
VNVPPPLDFLRGALPAWLGFSELECRLGVRLPPPVLARGPLLDVALVRLLLSEVGVELGPGTGVAFWRGGSLLPKL